MYNERWQLVATYDGADVREQFVHHAAGLDGRGGSSYIDSVILRTTYTGNGQSLVEDQRFYYAQNWRADVSVVLDDAGVQQERVIYSPYGQPFAMPAGDTNFDGDFEAGVDGDELADWDINGVPYRAYADVNLDGDIDGADATAASEHDLGWNVLTSDGASGVNNRLGYVGYIHDRDVATAAHVRHRVYKIDLGRWVHSDFQINGSSQVASALESSGIATGPAFGEDECIAFDSASDGGPSSDALAGGGVHGGGSLDGLGCKCAGGAWTTTPGSESYSCGGAVFPPNGKCPCYLRCVTQCTQTCPGTKTVQSWCIKIVKCFGRTFPVPYPCLKTVGCVDSRWGAYCGIWNNVCGYVKDSKCCATHPGNGEEYCDYGKII